MVPLAPKVSDTLVLLVENQGRLIQKEEFSRHCGPTASSRNGPRPQRLPVAQGSAGPRRPPKVHRNGAQARVPVHRVGTGIDEPPARLAAPPKWRGLQPASSRVASPSNGGSSRPCLSWLPAQPCISICRVPARELRELLLEIHSLAVLPLENLSGDKEQEYFADGMTDALTTDLAQVGSLRVISRTSAMQFKGSRETLPQIGHELKVDAVVEGTVARDENRVRVTAQLIEARSDRHLWARTYERDFKDVLAAG